MEIKIAVAYHKPSLLLPSEIYLPIHVGKALNPDYNLGIQGDDEGDNISIENSYYCELTAIYWLWKNVRSEVKGLFHYRRIFDVNPPLKLSLRKIKAEISHINYFPLTQYVEKEYIKKSQILANEIPFLMRSYDIIASQQATVRPSVKSFFSIIGSEYLAILKQAIETLFPKYTSLYKIMMEGKEISFGNMSVMRDNIFNDYCLFLFSILKEVKKILISEKYLIDLSTEKIFSRKLGYLAEIITSFFILKSKENKKILYLPICMMK